MLTTLKSFASTRYLQPRPLLLTAILATTGYSILSHIRNTSDMAAPNPLPNFVYKILPNTPVYQGTPVPVPADWEFPQTEVDADDGFVHMSTASQLPGTLSRFFATDETVQLLKIDYKRMSAFKVVKWDQASNGDSFPHLYARLTGEFVRDLKLAGKGSGWQDSVAQLKDKGWLEN